MDEEKEKEKKRKREKDIKSQKKPSAPKSRVFQRKKMEYSSLVIQLQGFRPQGQLV